MSSRSRTVFVVVRGTLAPSVPRSGFASIATTRSPRRLARVDPRATVVVVLPTPPLSDMTATRWQSYKGVRMCATRRRWRASSADGPGLIAPPDALKISFRQPPDAVSGAAGSSALVMSLPGARMTSAAPSWPDGRISGAGAGYSVLG